MKIRSVFRYLVVMGLERLCTVIDQIPWIWEGTWYWRGLLGCYPLRLANWSARLEDRWGTGYWRIQDPGKEVQVDD